MNRLLLVLLAAVAAHAWADLPDPLDSQRLAQGLSEPARWPETCRQRVPEVRSEGLLSHISFSPKPPRAVEPAWWALRWQGLVVPLPSERYRDLVLIGRRGKAIELILRGDESFVALMISGVDTPMAEIFPLSSKVEDPEAMPFSLAEAILAAYGTLNITCSPERRRQEIMALAGLPLIPIPGPFTVDRIFENVGSRRGWLESGMSNDGKRRYWRAVTLGSAEKPGLHVEVAAPDSRRYAAIGLEIGADDPSAVTDPLPPWLPTLQKALDEDSREAWLAALDALRQAEFGERGRERLSAFIRREWRQ